MVDREEEEMFSLLMLEGMRQYRLEGIHAFNFELFGLLDIPSWQLMPRFSSLVHASKYKQLSCSKINIAQHM